MEPFVEACALSWNTCPAVIFTWFFFMVAKRSVWPYMPCYLRLLNTGLKRATDSMTYRHGHHANYQEKQINECLSVIIEVSEQDSPRAWLNTTLARVIPVFTLNLSKGVRKCIHT